MSQRWWSWRLAARRGRGWTAPELTATVAAARTERALRLCAAAEAEAAAARVLTPHAGEYARIAAAVSANTVVVRKGPITRIETAGVADAPVAHSFFGGPVLARGGSGDLLSGIIGTLLSQTPSDPRGAAERGVVWHGLAADALARAHGPVAVRTTQLLDFFAAALRISDV